MPILRFSYLIAVFALMPPVWIQTVNAATGDEASPTRTISDDGTRHLSRLAQELMQCGEDETGIRQRLTLMLNHITTEPATYSVSGLTTPDPDKIPISVEQGNGRYLGGAQWIAGSSFVRFRMTYFTSPLPPVTDDNSRLLREMTLNDTLVHELAHCFFYSRYPKIAAIPRGEPHVICEGFAIHVAREFISRHYFSHGAMSPGFYEKTFLSPAYARLYQHFISRYTDAQGRIVRPLIDAAELRYAPPGYILRSRVQK